LYLGISAEASIRRISCGEYLHNHRTPQQINLGKVFCVQNSRVVSWRQLLLPNIVNSVNKRLIFFRPYGREDSNPSSGISTLELLAACCRRDTAE
jgi:hypothetical protein